MPAQAGTSADFRGLQRLAEVKSPEQECAFLELPCLTQSRHLPQCESTAMQHGSLLAPATAGSVLVEAGPAVICWLLLRGPLSWCLSGMCRNQSYTQRYSSGRTLRSSIIPIKALASDTHHITASRLAGAEAGGGCSGTGKRRRRKLRRRRRDRRQLWDRSAAAAAAAASAGRCR